LRVRRDCWTGGIERFVVKAEEAEKMEIPHGVGVRALFKREDPTSSPL